MNWSIVLQVCIVSFLMNFNHFRRFQGFGYLIFVSISYIDLLAVDLEKLHRLWEFLRMYHLVQLFFRLVFGLDHVSLYFVLSPVTLHVVLPGGFHFGYLMYIILNRIILVVQEIGPSLLLAHRIF